MARTITPEAPSYNLLGGETTIRGEITSSGDFRIDGTLIGSINSKGKIIIGSTGKVEGEVICQNAEISGEVKATIKVSELLSLKASAKVNGDIHTNKLAIEPGARFTGKCEMGGTSSPVNDAGKAK